MENVFMELVQKFKPIDQQVVTFSGTEPDALYDMTIRVENANLILVNSRLDTGGTAPKKVLLQIGNTIGTHFVVDNDPTQNFFTYMVQRNKIDPPEDSVTNISQYQCAIGYKMNGSLEKQTRFVIRDASTGAPITNLVYFCFQFMVI